MLLDVFLICLCLFACVFLSCSVLSSQDHHTITSTHGTTPENTPLHSVWLGLGNLVWNLRNPVFPTMHPDMFAILEIAGFKVFLL